MHDYEAQFGEGRLTEYIDIERLVDEIGLDGEEIAWHKGFLDFDSGDTHRLATLESE